MWPPPLVLNIDESTATCPECGAPGEQIMVWNYCGTQQADYSVFFVCGREEHVDLHDDIFRVERDGECLLWLRGIIKEIKMNAGCKHELAGWAYEQLVKVAQVICSDIEYMQMHRLDNHGLKRALTRLNAVLEDWDQQWPNGEVKAEMNDFLNELQGVGAEQAEPEAGEEVKL